MVLSVWKSENLCLCASIGHAEPLNQWKTMLSHKWYTFTQKGQEAINQVSCLLSITGAEHASLLGMSQITVFCRVIWVIWFWHSANANLIILECSKKIKESPQVFFYYNKKYYYWNNYLPTTGDRTCFEVQLKKLWNLYKSELVKNVILLDSSLNCRQFNVATANGACEGPLNSSCRFNTETMIPKHIIFNHKISKYSLPEVLQCTRRIVLAIVTDVAIHVCLVEGLKAPYIGFHTPALFLGDCQPIHRDSLYYICILILSNVVYSLIVPSVLHANSIPMPSLFCEGQINRLWLK